MVGHSGWDDGLRSPSNPGQPALGATSNQEKKTHTMKTFKFGQWSGKHFIAGLSTGLALSAAATDVIIDPDLETVISTGYYGQVDHAPEKLVDGSGLELQLHHGEAVPEQWPAHGTNVLTMFASSTEVYPTMTFTLPEVCDLRGLHYWNYNVPVSGGGGNDNGSGHHTSTPQLAGIRGVDVLASSAASTGPYVKVGTYEFAAAPGDPAYTGATLALGQTVRAKYVKLVVTSSWGEKGAGFSELRFLGQPAPELRMNSTTTNLVVSWPAPATGYRLEALGQRDSVDVWKPVTQPPRLDQGRYSYEIPAGEGSQLYRLVQPAL